MKVTQVYSLVNDALKEAIGAESILLEDLSNVVEAGKAIENYPGGDAVDNYVRKLINQTGKMVFVDYVYTGELPHLRKDGWEFGSIEMKIRTKMPKAIETEAWQLQDGSSYDPNIFYAPEVFAKFFNHKTTFTVPISITRMQVKESFQSAAQLNAFVSMIFNAINNAMTIATENLSKRCLNNFIAETIYDQFPNPGTTTPYTGAGGNRAVNLLKLFNDRYSQSLTAATCLEDPDFIRFASFEIRKRVKRMTTMSQLFNLGGTEKFTPMDRINLVLLDDFNEAAKTFLYSDTYHAEDVKLPAADTVTYFQGSGTDYAFSSISKIDVKTSGNHTVEISGILGVAYDDMAAAVNNFDKRVTTGYNPVGEFYNYWHKQDAQYINDFDENFIVFFVA